jgi:hypothetical protein
MRKSTILKSSVLARIGMYLVATAAAFSLGSCSKDEVAETKVSGLTVVNASPTPATYNVYLNSKQVNTAAIPFAGTIPYFQISAGPNTLDFTTASSTGKLLTKVVTLENEKAYSFFLIRQAGQLDGLLVTDDLSPSATDKAFVRFINLSPDATPLELVETGKTALLPEQAYKAASAFVATEAKTYSFDIKDKATGTVLKTLAGVSLVAGKMYTIAACGLVEASGNDLPLRLQVFTNR